MKPQNEWNKKEYFNSQPHKEADFLLSKPGSQVTHFNSQPHKEADVVRSPLYLHFVVFQLTASQGG